MSVATDHKPGCRAHRNLESSHGSDRCTSGVFGTRRNIPECRASCALPCRDCGDAHTLHSDASDGRSRQPFLFRKNIGKAIGSHHSRLNPASTQENGQTSVLSNLQIGIDGEDNRSFSCLHTSGFP
jgi:hypothetical protein